MPLYETEITRVPDAHKMSKEEEAYGQLEDEETHVDIPVQQEPERPRKTSNAKTDEEKEKEKRENVFAQMKNIKNMNMGQIKWLLTLAKAEIWLLILGSIMLIVSSATNLVIPQYIGAMIDSVTQEEDYLGRMVLTLFIVVLIMGITGAIRAYCYQVAGERVVARLRKTLFETIVVQEVAFFDMTKTGELLNRLSSDTKALENAVTVNVSMGVRYAIQIIGGVVILFAISWKLCLVMLSIVPAIVIGAVVYGKFVRSLSKKVQDALAASSDVAEESISNLRTVRSFGQEIHHKTLYGDAIDESFKLGKRLAFASGTFQGVMMFVGNLAIVLVLWYGGTLVRREEMTIGVLTSFLIYTLTVAMGLGALSSLWFDILRALGATERVHALVHRQPEIESKVLSTSYSNGTTLDTLNGHIEFTNVKFAYPSRKDNIVLDGFNLELRPGNIVALVGESGGGKSTTAALLQRFYDPDEGLIQIDGTRLQDLDPVWLRHQIGVVSQEPTLFATSITENISYGRVDFETGHVQVPMSDIISAAKKANAHEFITGFSEGYDTKVGERGVRLSGGQKQRIAIARAILKDPKILILDEATSALDADSEFAVQQALERLMEGRTVLIIAHRLSTVKNANMVCVVSKGKIVETGTHDELIQLDGMYKKLVLRQLQHNIPTVTSPVFENVSLD